MHKNLTEPAAPTAQRFVALVGSPNSGKTTLFNWLTGSKFKTVNYPGATVDYSIGRTQERFGERILIMDTPGTYSLHPKSPDERVTFEAIYAHKHYGHASLVVAIADALHLSRQLLLTQQLLDAGFQVVLAVTMNDLLVEHGESVDAALLSSKLGVPVVLINGRTGEGVSNLVTTIRRELEAPPPPAPELVLLWDSERVESVTREMQALVASVIRKKPPEPKSTASGSTSSAQIAAARRTAFERSRKLDAWLLHPVWGLVFFVVLMSGLFSSVFWAAAPAMDLVDRMFSALANWVLAFDEHNLALRFLANGVLASLSAVLVFVPQIFILFLGIILLEDSGYLARSATLVDRPLSYLGLGGRSFVPLLSGFACAVPAMMAARTINSKRERWLTLFILPLMSCSARLPVYALLLAFLFHGRPAWIAGVALTGIYVGALTFGGLAALIVSRFIKMDETSFFMLELPIYRAPRLHTVLSQAVTRTSMFVRRAGPPIFTFALIVWIGTTFPNFREEDTTARLNTSYAARLGQVIEPIFVPMGGDWRTGVGLISAFAAREVFASSLAVVFQVADEDTTMQQTLLAKMRDARAPTGYPLFTVASVLGLIVFFMIALQCLSTVVMAAREAGTWTFAVMQLVAFNVIAYVLSVALVQGLRFMGIA